MIENEQRPEQPDYATTWGSRLRRTRTRPPRGAWIASVVLHGLVIALLWLAGADLRNNAPEFLPFSVSLVSPPPAVLGEPEPVITNAPVVAEPQPVPDTPKPEAPTTQPPKPRTQAATQRPVERVPDAAPAKGPDPKPVSVSGEDMDVRIDGQQFPYP